MANEDPTKIPEIESGIVFSLAALSPIVKKKFFH